MPRNALSALPTPQPRTLSIETRSAPRPNVDQLVEQLLKPDEITDGTLDEILNHAQVRKHGMLGRLSSSQQHLVSSVVSILQDRIAADARKNAQALKQIIHAEREALQSVSRSFAETAKHLYQLPLLGVGRDPEPPRASAPQEAAWSPPEGPSWIQRLLTWGNLLAFTAIAMAVLALKTTIETADYEARYTIAQASLDELKERHTSLQTAQEELRGEYKALTEENTALQTRLAETTTRAEGDKRQWEADLQRSEQALAETRDALTAQQALTEKTETSRQQQRDTLQAEISELKQSLAAARGRESRNQKNANEWKSLAQERKDEIEELKTLLEKRGIAAESAKAADKEEAGFLGIF